jgi:hypothetical protein
VKSEDFAFVPSEIVLSPPEDTVSVARYVERRCRVCTSGEHEAIELLCLSRGLSMDRSADEVFRLFGIRVSGKALLNHMTSHTDSVDSARMGAILKVVRETGGGEDSDVPLSKALVEVLLLQAMGKVIEGDINVRSLSDAMKLVALADSVKRTEHKIHIDERQLEIESGATSQSIEDLYRQLGYIMQALKNSVPTEYLQAAIMEAWKLGLGREFVDLTDVPIYQSDVGDYEELDMTQVVEDVNQLGRPKTRLELTEGVVVVVEEVDADIPPE